MICLAACALCLSISRLPTDLVFRQQHAELCGKGFFCATRHFYGTRAVQPCCAIIYNNSPYVCAAAISTHLNARSFSLDVVFISDFLEIDSQDTAVVRTDAVVAERMRTSSLRSAVSRSCNARSVLDVSRQERTLLGRCHALPEHVDNGPVRT